MSTVFTVTVTCDARQHWGCHDRVEREADSPRAFDSFATELFQQGWWRGFRNTNPAPSDAEGVATSDTMVAYDVCPACADLPEHAPACPHCGAVSAHPDDLANRYCARCHRYAQEPSLHGA